MTDARLIRTCSIWRALEVVGDTPTLLILEASWLGARRFEDFRRRTGLLKALLSHRLKRLVAAGLFQRLPYSSSPLREEYAMTAKGRDLYWVALMLLAWEQKWASSPDRISVELVHRPCGARFAPMPACGSCNADIDATQVQWSEGPGVGWMPPIYSRRRQQRDSSDSGTTLFEEAAQLMGDRWAALILRSIFTGRNRFDDIRRDTAIATNILAERLGWLNEIGVIRPVRYAENPPRHEYRLRRKGMDYYPALLMLLRWGDRHYATASGPPLLLTHRGCGGPLDPQVVCSACRAPVAARDVQFFIRERQDEPVFRQAAAG